MGLVVSAARMMYLNGYRHDLEYKVQLISQARMGLLNNLNTLMANGADMDPDSPEVKLMEQRKQRLMLIDKKLEQELKAYQVKLDSVTAEMQGVQRGLQKNIEIAYGGR